MQVLKKHKLLVLITLLLVIALIVSVVFLVQNAPQPAVSPTPTLPLSNSPSPTNPTPNPTNTTNPSASQTPALSTQTPNPTSPTSSPTPTTATASPPPTSTSSTPSFLFPGEVTEYEGQSLTPVGTYIQYLIQHPDVAIKGVQYIDPAKYRLAITGMVNNPTNYSYDQVVNGFNSTLQVASLLCVEGWGVTMLWQGVPIMDLINQTGAGSGANTIIFIAADGYTSSLPLDYVKQNNIMIAYKMNNVTLTPQLGWPFFLVAKSQYGYKWVEWVTEINISGNSNYLGYWESRGYPNDATVPAPYG